MLFDDEDGEDMTLVTEGWFLLVSLGGTGVAPGTNRR